MMSGNAGFPVNATHECPVADLISSTQEPITTDGSAEGLLAGNQSFRTPARRRLPGVRVTRPAAEFKELSDDYLRVIELMVYGLDEGGEIDNEWIEAGVPLTLRQAALAGGVRVRQAKEVYETALFKTALNEALLGQRASERPKNLHTAIKIRDDEGDGSAATKTVRLKAIQTIEGTDGRAKVQATVNTHTNIKPGYVIRFKAPRAEQSVPDGSEAKAMEGSMSDRGGA